MPFVSPYRFTNMEELLKERLGQPEVSREGNPKKFIDRSDPRYQESIYAEPDSPPSMDPGNLGMIGQIRGVAKPTAQWIRKMMQTEIKARGPREYSGDVDSDIASRLLRGTWYRGQEATPSVRLEGGRIRTAHRGTEWEGRPDLRTENPGQGNIGEPRGISLSYSPETAKYFGKEYLESNPVDRLTGKASSVHYRAMQLDDPDKVSTLLAAQDKMLDRAAKIENIGERKKINRMMPLFEGSPEERVLLGYKEEHGKILNEAYTKAAQRMMEIDPIVRKFALQRGGRHFDEAIHAADNAPAVPKVYPEGTSRTKYFNELMTEELKSRGYKGLLHSPHRYQEYELRMFDPADVMHIDKRRAVVRRSQDFDVARTPFEDNSSVARLADRKQELQDLHEESTRGKTGAHLYEWYRDIPGDAILGEKYAKPGRRLLENKTNREMKVLDDMLNDVEGFNPKSEASQMLNLFGGEHEAAVAELMKGKSYDKAKTSKVIQSIVDHQKGKWSTEGPPTLSEKGKKLADATNEAVFGGVDKHKANVDATAKVLEVPYADMSPDDKMHFSSAVEIWNNAKLQTKNTLSSQSSTTKYWLDKFSNNEYGQDFAALLPGGEKNYYLGGTAAAPGKGKTPILDAKINDKIKSQASKYYQDEYTKLMSTLNEDDGVYEVANAIIKTAGNKDYGKSLAIGGYSKGWLDTEEFQKVLKMVNQHFDK